MKTKTFGEIAKSHGFDNLDDFYNAIKKEVDIAKSKSFNVGDEIK
jgi:RNAse (barnase) inhibitor barstar